MHAVSCKRKASTQPSSFHSNFSSNSKYQKINEMGSPGNADSKTDLVESTSIGILYPGSGHISFDVGEISHPKYGTARLKGTLPISLKEGEWRKYSPEAQQNAFTHIVTWLENNNFEFRDLEERDKLIRIGTITAACVFPRGQNSDAELSIPIIALILTMFAMDDVLESLLFNDEDIQGSNAHDKVWETINDILEGRYEGASQLPKPQFPMLEPAYWFAFLAYDQGKEDGLLVFTKFMMEVIMKEKDYWYNASTLLNDAKFINACSEETFLQIKEADAAGGIIRASMPVCFGFDLTKKLKANIVFERIHKAMCRIGFISNDLFGIEKEIDLANPSNLVLRKVTQKGLSFQEAVDESLKFLQNESVDLILCCQKLMEKYDLESDEYVAAEAYKYSLNSNLEWLADCPRWCMPKFTYHYY